jgi:hypothetical protein
MSSIHSITEMEVVPECSLRNEHMDFVLGMPICQAISSLQHAARHFRNIELTYCQKVISFQDLYPFFRIHCRETSVSI